MQTDDGASATGQVADALARCFDSLIDRGVDRGVARRFALQRLVALCAGGSPEHTTAALCDRGWIRRDGQLAAPAPVSLTQAEQWMVAACDGTRVGPEVIGALYEHSLQAGQRHTGGVHFTAPADIARIVEPTIVEPWNAWIAAADSPRALRELHARMLRYTVLDPACGSGNFLVAAFRALRRLEAGLWDRLGERTADAVGIDRLFGIDSDALAVEVAEVTLRLVAGGTVAANLVVMDALVDADGARPPWPVVDVIVGNPPFLDARKRTISHGQAYTRRLRAAYPDIPGRADHCVYWFRRAHDEVANWSAEDPVRGRVGLVGTKTIRENFSRQGGLDHIVGHGGVIVEAVASQAWSGAAAVDVSIVNWVKGDYTGPRVLHTQHDERDPAWTRREVAAISSALTAGTDVSQARPLVVVTRDKRCFEGQQPGHHGFRIDAATHRRWAGVDPRIDDVVFEYLIGASLLTGKYVEAPEYIIDFGERSLAEAAQHPDALARVRGAVLPTWQADAHREAQDSPGVGEHRRRLASWWRLKRRRPEMLAAIAALPRYIVCVRHTKRPIFTFVASAIRPDSALTVFAFADDYAFGILQSIIHTQWFEARCSSLGRRFRYTHESVFAAFPWPQRASAADIEAVATCARRLRAARGESMRTTNGGLRALYKQLEQPGRHPLRAAHEALDAAVMQAYGFVAGRDVLAQILELNVRVATAPDAAGPGLPSAMQGTLDLVSEDCVGR